MSEVLRVFVAVDVEDPTLVGRIAHVRDLFVGTGVPMKPVEEQNIHITLRFIGEVPRSVVDSIISDVLSRVSFKPFEVSIKGVGAFPTVLRPRVIWVGVEKGAEELKRIRDEIERGLRRLGLRPEKEEFIPHITLARLKGARNVQAVIKLLQELSDLDLGVMRVESIRLKQSTLTPRGPVYRTLYEVRAG